LTSQFGSISDVNQIRHEALNLNSPSTLRVESTTDVKFFVARRVPLLSIEFHAETSRDHREESTGDTRSLTVSRRVDNRFNEIVLKSKNDAIKKSISGTFLDAAFSLELRKNAVFLSSSRYESTCP